jgi:hypothetical protein
MTKKFTIKQSDLKKLHKIIQELENKYSTKKVQNLNLSGFLSSALEIGNSGNIDTDVKRAILNTAGQFSADPSDLNSGTLLKENLNFNDNDFASLTRALNNVIKNYKNNITLNLSDVSKCKKVSDIIKLVKDKMLIPVNYE